VGQGHAHPENIESRLSEMPFPRLWAEILQNSDGQKTALLLYRLYSSIGKNWEGGGLGPHPRFLRPCCTFSRTYYLNC
jgi:hypothetical protein